MAIGHSFARTLARSLQEVHVNRRLFVYRVRARWARATQPLREVLTRALWSLKLAAEDAYDQQSWENRWPRMKPRPRLRQVRHDVLVSLAYRFDWRGHPGKFEGCGSQLIGQWLYDVSMDGGQDADTGDTEHGGWHAIFYGPFPWDARQDVAIILSQWSSGAVTYGWYDTRHEADAAFAEANDDYVDSQYDARCAICDEGVITSEDDDWDEEAEAHRSCLDSKRENDAYDQARDDALMIDAEFEARFETASDGGEL